MLAAGIKPPTSLFSFSGGARKILTPKAFLGFRFNLQYGFSELRWGYLMQLKYHPPAFDTADTNSGVVAPPAIPACIIGYLMSSFSHSIFMVSSSHHLKFTYTEYFRASMRSVKYYIV